MAVNIKIDDSELRKSLSKLSEFPKEIPKATNAALNRTVTFVNKNIKKEVSGEYSIKSVEVAQTLKVKKSTTNNLSAKITSIGKPITLSHFPANLKSGWSKGSNLKVKVKKSGYKKINTHPRAFVTAIDGNLHIVRRETSKQYPIKVLKTLSVPQMVSNSELSENILEQANEQLKNRINHEIEFRLNKLTSRR
ncbi:MAG: phage tail protein [Clostridium butyricum]|nr:phage tail protein [Clostridium butyricum]